MDGIKLSSILKNIAKKPLEQSLSNAREFRSTQTVELQEFISMSV